MNEMSPAFAVNAAPGSGVRDPDRAELAVRYGNVPTTRAMESLAGLISAAFMVNAEHRRMSGVDRRLTEAKRACQLEYTPEEVSKLEKAGLSGDIYTPITDVKCRAANALLSNLFNAQAGKSWSLAPTPDPDVPESVTVEAFQSIVQEIFSVTAQTGQVPSEEEVFLAARERVDEVFDAKVKWARQRAERMETRVHDNMVEGGWDDAFALFLEYLCTYGTALVIGPEMRVMPVTGCREGRLGNLKYKMEYRSIPCFEAVNPWDCYPAPNARRVEDGALCIRVRYTSEELWRYAAASGGPQSVTGWIPETVRALLARYPNGGYKIPMQPYDPVRRRLEGDGVNSGNDCTLEGIRCFATVRGSVLRGLGILKGLDGKAVDPSQFYQVDAVAVADFVVYCRLVDPRMGRPVSKGVFYSNPGAWWGNSVASKLVTVQKTMNASVKNLIRNMAMSSGPMFWVNDASRLVDANPATRFTVKPYKMFAFNTGMMGQAGAPMGAIDIPSHIREIHETYQRMREQSDIDSGIPAFSVGTGPTNNSVLRTASGYAMFTEASGLIMKLCALGIDNHVIRNVVRMEVRRLLIYDGDMSIKGDCEVNPSGLVGQLLRAVESENRQRMLATVNASPLLTQVVGVKGLVALLRPEFKALGINPNDVFPSEQKMELLEKIQEVQALNAALMPEGQAAEGDGQDGQPPQPGADRQQAVRQSIERNPQEAALRRGLPQLGRVRERQGAA